MKNKENKERKIYNYLLSIITLLIFILFYLFYFTLFADICSAVSSGIRGGFFKVSMARLNIRVRNYLFGSLTRQEIGFFDVTKTG